MDKTVTMKNKCQAQEKIPQEPKPHFFDPAKETKRQREARLNAIVKKALEGIKQRD